MSTSGRELRREPDGSYALAGAGALRWQGWGRTRAIATVDGRSWRFERRGFWRRTAVAVPDGAPSGAEPELSWASDWRGGTVSAGGRTYAWRRRYTWWRTRYVVSHGSQAVATFDTAGWRSDHVRVDEHVAGALPPLLQLFCCWLTIMGSRDEAAATAAGT